MRSFGTKPGQGDLKLGGPHFLDGRCQGSSHTACMHIQAKEHWCTGSTLLPLEKQWHPPSTQRRSSRREKRLSMGMPVFPSRRPGAAMVHWLWGMSRQHCWSPTQGDHLLRAGCVLLCGIWSWQRCPISLPSVFHGHLNPTKPTVFVVAEAGQKYFLRIFRVSLLKGSSSQAPQEKHSGRHYTILLPSL